MSSNVVTTDFIVEIPVVSEPAIHPDGQTVAYVRSHVDRVTMDTSSQIEFVPWAGGESRSLTRGPADRSPAWSPDGSSLAFLRRTPNGGHAGHPQVWVLPTSGGEARSVTALDRGVEHFRWSADGKSLLCVSRIDPEAIPPEPHRPPRARLVTKLRYRVDGEGWRGEAHRALFVVRLDRSNASRRLTRGRHDCSLAEFSPDSSRIAFRSSSRRRGGEPGPYDAELCVVSAQGGHVQRVVRDAYQLRALAWSPDGSRIAYVADDGRRRSEPCIWVVDLRDGGRKQLTDDRLHTGSSELAWRGARGALLFKATVRGEDRLYRASASGDPALVHGTGAAMTALSVTPDGERGACISSQPDRPAEVLALDLGQEQSRALTAASRAYLDGRTICRTERFSIRRDGFEIDCRLTLPPTFSARQSYPLVLEVHGGPQSHFGEGFSPMAQVLAGAGFLVLRVNPRGSTSYGAPFTSAVYGDWGGQDFADLMAVLDSVCERPYVDRTRLGISGYSYGGYMSAWAATQTDRFRAAVAGAPVTNLVSCYGTDDLSPWLEDELGGTPWAEAEHYAARSPITHVTKVATPILLLHGEDDLRCPISQSEEFFVALKRLRKTVEFVRYPGSGHTFFAHGHPALRQDYYERIANWFSRWLLPAATARPRNAASTRLTRPGSPR